jgi:hypothetical protein
MRRSNAEGSDTFTAKQVFFDRTLALHADRLGVSNRVQAKALINLFRSVDFFATWP